MVESVPKSASQARRRVRMRWWFPIAAGLIGCLLTTVLLEVGLRGYLAVRGWTSNCYATSLFLFEPDTEKGYRLAKNYVLVSSVFRQSTNEEGTRGPNWTAAKPTGVLRVLLLGGSSTFGYLVNDGEEAARLVEGLLSQRLGRQVEVINAGVPGYNLYQIVPHAESLAQTCHPDWIVLHGGWNDLVYLTANQPFPQSVAQRPVASGAERWLRHSVLYGFLAYRVGGRGLALAPAQVEAMQITSDGATAFTRHLDRLANVASRHRARLAVVTEATAARADVDDHLRPFLHRDAMAADRMIELATQWRKLMGDWAKNREVPYADASDSIKPDGNEMADYVHLTRVGEQKLAAFLTDFLANLMTQPHRESPLDRRD